MRSEQNMTVDESRQLRERANEYRDNGEFSQSGWLFTLAGYEMLGDCRYRDSRVSSGTNLGVAIYCFHSAAIDYLKAGDPKRSANRCSQAVTIIEGFRDVLDPEPAIDGVLLECVGDFHALRARPESDEFYENALAAYARADHPRGWQAEPVFDWAIQFLIELGSFVGKPIAVDTQVDMLDSFEQRVSLKQDRLPVLLAEITEDGGAL